MVFFWLCLFTPLPGQEFTYLHYQQGYELPSQFVNSLFQASDGRIWVATRGGISTYDGTRWNRIGRDEIKTPNIAIERVIKGQDGSIWAIDSNRITKMNIFTQNRAGWKRVMDQPIPDAHDSEIWIECLVRTDRDGHPFLALTTNTGSLITYQDRFGWSRHALPKQNPRIVISGISPYYDSLLISTNQGLFRYENRQLFYADEFNCRLPDHDLLGVAWEEAPHGRDGALWIVGRNWIRHDVRTGLPPRDWDIPRQSAQYSSIVPDRQGGFYILLHQANKYRPSRLFHHSGSTGEREQINDHSSMQDRLIQCMTLDEENNLWIGTSRGVSKLVNRSFKTFRRRHGLLEDEVSAIHFLPDGDVMLGHNTGYTHFRKGRFIPHPFPETALTQRVLDITNTPEGKIYMACNDHGLLEVGRDGKARFLRSPVPDDSFVNSVTWDPGQGKLWLACSDGLYFYLNGEFTAETLTLPDTGIYCRTVQRHPDGLITVATAQHGLFLSRGQAWIRSYSRAFPLANNVFFCLQHARYGMLLATSAGLYRSEHEDLVPFIMGETVLSDACYSLEQDSRGELWIGTQTGLLSWDGKRLKRHRSGDGLLGQEINRNAMKTAPDGSLWVGSIDGLAIHSPPRTEAPPVPAPRVVITAIRRNNRDHAPADPLNLSYGENSFSLQFFCPSFINEYENRYRHRLTGMDETWQEVKGPGINQVSYQNLPSGSYRFEIKAANADGQWGEISQSGLITIRLPFWRSGIFISLTALILLLIPIWAAYAYAQKRHAKKLEREVLIRTEELSQQKTELERLNDELRQANTTKNKFFSIIAHDLRNPFTSLLTGTEFLVENYPVLSPDMKKRHIQDIHEAAKLTYDLVNNLLDWSRTQLDRMEFIPSRIDLTRLIRQILKLLEADTERKSLKVTLLIPPRCDMLGDRHMMRFIFRNLISNAIKFTPRGGHISVTVYDQAETWSVAIQDTGVGIHPDKLAALNTPSTPLSSTGTEGERGTGLGLILCREFIQLHRGRLSISSLVDQGSLFTVNLPKGSLLSPQHRGVPPPDRAADSLPEA